ncbi:ABC-type multidrug transport system, ATPase and permease component [Pseudomonas sp. StFLB209]|nr:ABC-type multidrug transport system, ATPase and permease component [Pseudomonas sp. StFLB209]
MAYAGMLGLQTAAVICAVLVPWALGQITRLVTQGLETDRAFDALTWPLLGLTALLVLEMLFVRCASALHVYTLPRQRRAVTHALFAYLQQHSHRYITSEFAGALAHRISEVSLGTTMALAILIFDLIPLLVTLSLAVLLLATADLWLAAFMGFWAAGFLGLCWFLARRSHPLARAFSAARSVSTGKVVDAVTNLTNIRLFARHPFEHQYLGRFLDREVEAAKRSLGYMEKSAGSRTAAACCSSWASCCWRCGCGSAAVSILPPSSPPPACR